ncbi:MAG: class D beta-lactamase [Saprospiraceae bacterium]|nr:class D beta-lactamase [Saprospiraceae bacterium]
MTSQQTPKHQNKKPSAIILAINLFIIFILLSSYKTNPSIEIRSDLKKYYDAYQVEGSFCLYDPVADKYVLYNPDQFEKEFSPASTFKICNSLIGLETGVIADENFVIPWDSLERQNPNWNADHDLKTAFKNSTVWYYQELARRVGKTQMKTWLEKVKYGNADTTGGIDQFWLTGDLRITPKQQIDFIKRLHDNDLPFSQRSMDIVKDIMIVSDTLGTVIRAKTGWSIQGNQDVGWYVGYIEQNQQVYYFANCIQSTDPNNKDFGRARIEIFDQAIEALKILKK